MNEHWLMDNDRPEIPLSEFDVYIFMKAWTANLTNVADHSAGLV